MLRPDLTFVKLRLLIFYLEIRAATDLIVNLISKYQFSCLFYKVDLIVSRLKVFIEHGVVSDFFIYSRHRLFVTIFIFVPDHYPCIIAIVIGYKDAVGCLELGRFLGIILVHLGIIINRLSITPMTQGLPWMEQVPVTTASNKPVARRVFSSLRG
mgnify:CR=1 FL=1